MRFAANAVRLHALAYNLANFLDFGAARGGQVLVTDHAARPAGQDRRQDRPTWPLACLPDGGGHGVACAIPADSDGDRRVAARGATPMLRPTMAEDRVGLGQERCVRVAAGRASLGGNAGFAEEAARLAATLCANLTVLCCVRPGFVYRFQIEDWIARISGKCGLTGGWQFLHPKSASKCGAVKGYTSWTK